MRCGQVPDDWPEGTFDLIVLSELLYYLDDGELAAVLQRARRSLCRDGHVVAVHYRRFVDAHSRTGDSVHDALRGALAEPLATYREADFALDVFTTPRSTPATSNPTTQGEP